VSLFLYIIYEVLYVTVSFFRPDLFGFHAEQPAGLFPALALHYGKAGPDGRLVRAKERDLGQRLFIFR